MNAKSLRVLEFGKVLHLLAEHTAFSAGRELALALIKGDSAGKHVALSKIEGRIDRQRAEGTEMEALRRARLAEDMEAAA